MSWTGFDGRPLFELDGGRQVPAADGGFRRPRHQIVENEPAVEASALLRRLEAETATRTDAAPRARRRRYRDDDETNDVLARLLGQ